MKKTLIFLMFLMLPSCISNMQLPKYDQFKVIEKKEDHYVFVITSGPYKGEVFECDCHDRTMEDGHHYILRSYLREQIKHNKKGHLM